MAGALRAGRDRLAAELHDNAKQFPGRYERAIAWANHAIFGLRLYKQLIVEACSIASEDVTEKMFIRDP